MEVRLPIWVVTLLVLEAFLLRQRKRPEHAKKIVDNRVGSRSRTGWSQRSSSILNPDTDDELDALSRRQELDTAFIPCEELQLNPISEAGGGNCICFSGHTTNVLEW